MCQTGPGPRAVREKAPDTQSGYKDSWALASLWKADVILLRVHQLAPQECCG